MIDNGNASLDSTQYWPGNRININLHINSIYVRPEITMQSLLYHCTVKVSAFPPLPDAAHTISMGTVWKNAKQTFLG